MSIAFLMDGRAAMKMIRSTSSTSIIGVTLMSFDSPPLPPVDIAILLSSSWWGSRWCTQRARRGRLRLAVAGNGRDRPRLLIADHTDNADAVLHRQIHRIDHFAVVKVLVGLEIHDV